MQVAKIEIYPGYLRSHKNTQGQKKNMPQASQAASHRFYKDLK